MIQSGSWFACDSGYEVYSPGLEVWTGDVPTPEKAETIANALEAFYDGPSLERQRDEARQLLTQYSAEREHNANMAQMWRAVADDACELLVSMPCLSSGQEREKASIAKAYEEAKSHNLTASPP